MTDALNYRPRTILDEDDEYDAFVERVDNGEQCPDCKSRIGIERTQAMGLALFKCRGCGCAFFDWATRPTLDAPSI